MQGLTPMTRFTIHCLTPKLREVRVAGVHTNEAGERVALLRAYDKATGADVGTVNMPAKQTGSPMSYAINGRQYVVIAVSGVNGAELIAYALPQ